MFLDIVKVFLIAHREVMDLVFKVELDSLLLEVLDNISVWMRSNVDVSGNAVDLNVTMDPASLL